MRISNSSETFIAHPFLHCAAVQNLTRVITLVLIVFLSGCAQNIVNKDPVPFWPKLPDRPRFMYESSLRSESSVIRLSKTDKMRSMVLGENDQELIAYEKPYDVAARYGRIVVSDTMVNTLVLFDLARNRLMRIGHLKYGKLENPFGVGMDYLLNIYVADQSARTVRMYDDVGYYLGSIGSSDTLERPVDVAANPPGDRIYVVDSGGISSTTHRIVVFDGEGNHLFNIGTRGTREGEFNLPIQAAVAPNGTLYVLDAGNFRVQAFDRDGNFLFSFGKVGRNLGEFARPRGIAVDDDGNIYVTDAAFGNFQIFNSKGQLLMWVGESGMGNKPGHYAMPAGIAVDETNRVYVVDQLHRKIEVIRRLSEEEGIAMVELEKAKIAKGGVSSIPLPATRGTSFSSTSLETSLDGMDPDVIIPTDEELVELKRKAAIEKARAERNKQAEVETKGRASQKLSYPDGDY